jgi:hypothetical protein
MGPGLRPYVKREYPMWLHRASHDKGGGFEFEQVLVGSDVEAAAHLSRGFAEEPLIALERLKAQELEYAKLAAEREHEIKHKLSPKAVAEVRAEEATYSGHMPTMAETPIKRRGRPKKVAAE